MLRTTVTLQNGPLTSGFLNVPSFLLKAILQHNKKGLHHLAIDVEEHYVLAVLHSMMTLLGLFIHQHTSENIPYSGLERLEVSLESTESGDMERCFSWAGYYLASILQHQRAINSLSLQSWPLTSPKLVSAISSLFHQPHYTSVSLKHMIIPFPLFQELVGSFLSSPAQQLSHQMLHVFTWEVFRVRNMSTVWYNFFTPKPPQTLFERKWKPFHNTSLQPTVYILEAKK